MINTLKKGIKKLVFHFIKPPIHYVKTSYAQAGEDVIIKFLFDSKKIHQPSYLELGVFFPDVHNNTYLFYKNGSRGVLVEADESLINNIKQVRSEDTVLNIGVGINDSTVADFYVFNDSAISTFDKEEAAYREKQGTYKIVKVLKIPIKSINKIISENFTTYPLLLSIDVEGLDLNILKTLDFSSYPISVICAETCTYSENHIKPKDDRIAEFMNSKGYFLYADTYINSIFVNSKWFYGDESD